jgi:hypothetical protein
LNWQGSRAGGLICGLATGTALRNPTVEARLAMRHWQTNQETTRKRHEHTQECY